MSKAQGQFTIIDYNDALTLTGYIGSNLAKTQMYNPDNGSYTPDWKTKNLVLTPSLYVIGTTADQIATANVTSVKWYVGDSNTAITAGTNYGLSGAKSHILTVKANVMAELPGIDYRCVITYKDESTGLSLTHPLTISFSRVVNGSGIVDLLVTTPNGNVFKNEEVASLTAKAELWRGSTVDTTKVSYKWAVMDASVTATASTGYDADFGIGWRKLSDTADKYTGTATKSCPGNWMYARMGDLASKVTATLGGDVKPADPVKPTPVGIKAGDLVTITGSTYYNGKAIPGWVKKLRWYVVEVSGDRTVINKDESGRYAIMSPVKTSALAVAGTKPSEDYRIHTVVHGDTLWAIAKKYLGNGSRYKEIVSLNGLKSNVIYSGMKLKIPNK